MVGVGCSKRCHYFFSCVALVSWRSSGNGPPLLWKGDCLRAWVRMARGVTDEEVVVAACVLILEAVETRRDRREKRLRGEERRGEDHVKNCCPTALEIGARINGRLMRHKGKQVKRYRSEGE